MRGFYEIIMRKPFMVSLSNHGPILRQAQGERDEDDDFYDDEDEEREWCD